MRTPQVLFEDNHLLVLEKPSGWIVQGAQVDDLSMLEWGKDYIKQKYHKPGNVYLSAVSRLDRDVSGVVPLARTSKAAARLNEQIQKRSVQKTYLAVVSPSPKLQQQRLVHRLARDERLAKTVVKQATSAGADEAILDYDLLQSNGDHGLVRIHLVTGRKHQIRCQMAEIGCPIAGDKKYGSKIPLRDWIALHCFSFGLVHPTTAEQLHFTCLPPSNWDRFGLNIKGLLAD